MKHKNETYTHFFFCSKVEYNLKKYKFINSECAYYEDEDGWGTGKGIGEGGWNNGSGWGGGRNDNWGSGWGSGWGKKEGAGDGDGEGWLINKNKVYSL